MFMANETTNEQRCLDSYSTIKSSIDTLKLTNSIQATKPTVNFKTIKATSLENSSIKTTSLSTSLQSASLEQIEESSINNLSATNLSIKDTFLQTSLDSNLDHLKSNQEKRPYSDNSLEFSILNKHQAGGDLLHINNLKVQNNQNLNRNYFDATAAASDNCLVCNCEFKHNDLSNDHLIGNSFQSAKCYCNKCNLTSGLNNDLYDHNLNSFLFKKESQSSSFRTSLCDGDFKKQIKAANCKVCLVNLDNCLCNILITKQPTATDTSKPSLNSSLSIESNQLNSNLINRTNKVNNTKYFQPRFADQKSLSLTSHSSQSVSYSSSSYSKNSQSSPSIPISSNCFNYFDLFTTKTKLTNSLSDNLFTNFKHNLTSSLLLNSSTTNSSSNSSFSSSFKTTSFKTTSSSKSPFKYLLTCLVATKLNLLIKLIRKFYFNICFLVTLLSNLIRPSKEDQHKLCEHRSKIMRLKERVVILFLIACCVLCTFFVLQLKISEDMDSSTKFRFVFLFFFIQFYNFYNNKQN